LKVTAQRKVGENFFVTREGYSKAFSLLKDIMYGKTGPRDYWTTIQKVKDLTLDKRYWFGIIPDDVARRHISRIQMSTVGVISYIVYGSGENRGTWRILYKFPKDPNFFAYNSQLKSRIHQSRDFGSQEFLNVQQVVEGDLERVSKEFCRDGRWKLPDDEQMKISFHTPGALCYLKESKTAYVKSNETPKDMMRRIKLEAKQQKEDQEKEKRGKEGPDVKDEQDFSKIKVVNEISDISIISKN